MTNRNRPDAFNDLRQTVDQLFDHGLARSWRLLQGTMHEFPVDIWDSGDAVELQAALPGVRPEDVDIKVANDVLTVKAERHANTEDRTYYRQEIEPGSYSRSFTLPVGVESEKAEASFENGILKLRLPKAEAVRTTQIKINMGPSDRAS